MNIRMKHKFIYHSLNGHHDYRVIWKCDGRKDTTGQTTISGGEERNFVPEKAVSAWDVKCYEKIITRNV